MSEYVMRKVTLLTHGGGLVATVHIPPFPDFAMPDVLVWGERYFRPTNGIIDVYREAFGLAVTPDDVRRTQLRAG